MVCDNIIQGLLDGHFFLAFPSSFLKQVHTQSNKNSNKELQRKYPFLFHFGNKKKKIAITKTKTPPLSLSLTFFYLYFLKTEKTKKHFHVRRKAQSFFCVLKLIKQNRTHFSSSFLVLKKHGASEIISTKSPARVSGVVSDSFFISGEICGGEEQLDGDISRQNQREA